MENRARYAEALPGVSLDYRAEGESAKEDLVLESAAAPSVYRFSLKTSAGLTPHENRAGGIDFVAVNGRTAFSFAPPLIEDSSAAEETGPVTMSLSDSRDVVTLRADRAWLDAPERVYPVRLDPTITHGAQNDCFMSSMTPTQARCDEELEVGGTPSPNLHEDRSLVRFNPAAVIPKGSVIMDAKLGLYAHAQRTTTAIPVAVHEATKPWTGSATWQTFDGVSAWEAPGGDFKPPVEATNAAVGATLGWYHWNLQPATVQRWLADQTKNHGILVKGPGELAENALDFSSRDYDSANKPKLEITYLHKIGRRPDWTFETTKLTDRMEASVNVASGNLVLEAHDLQVPGTGLDLTVARTYNSLSTTELDLGPGLALLDRARRAPARALRRRAGLSLPWRRLVPLRPKRRRLLLRDEGLPGKAREGLRRLVHADLQRVEAAVSLQPRRPDARAPGRKRQQDRRRRGLGELAHRHDHGHPGSRHEDGLQRHRRPHADDRLGRAHLWLCLRRLEPADELHGPRRQDHGLRLRHERAAPCASQTPRAR